MAGDEQFSGKKRPAIDNRAQDGRNAKGDAGAFVRLDGAVHCPLIGRRMAREDFKKAICAANDNNNSGGGHDDR